MKYKLGDFVRFVDEKIEGYITRIIDDDMIGVTGSDDFEIPVLASKVTTVHGFEPNGKLQPDDTDSASADSSSFKSTGTYLAVVPDAKAASVVHFHLINETSFQLYFTLYTEEQKQYKGEFANTLQANSSLVIYSAQLADIQLWPAFKLQLLQFTKQIADNIDPLIFKEKFKAKDFAGAKKKVPLINQMGWLIMLDEPELQIDAEKLKESFFKPAEEKKTVERPNTEVDLHIEKLRDDYQFLRSDEIADIQLNHFNKVLDAAIVHQLPEIVFIHGAGNGVLRDQLHKLLSRHNKVKTFIDARKEKFGYGATKVILK